MKSNIFFRFERLSLLYRAICVKQTWEVCGDVVHDSWSSLKLFLRNYAYEHQGRSPDYGPAAADTIEEIRIRGKPLEANVAHEAWDLFSKKLRDGKLNHARNPLCPNGIKYPPEGAGRTTKKKSAIQVAASIEKPLVAWASEGIASGRLKETHSRLCQIGGIGGKIASLFLRDIAVENGLVPNGDRELLQPVDVWVRFVVRKLSNESPLDDRDRSCAIFIVAQAAAPERANQGIWYFCAKMSESSQYLVRRNLADQKHFDEALERHLIGLETGAGAVSESRREMSEQCATSRRGSDNEDATP